MCLPVQFVLSMTKRFEFCVGFCQIPSQRLNLHAINIMHILQGLFQQARTSV